ncbi:hypothetical protein LIER_39074 [Lithospermum erythrorhizon]|uniref:Uncharacterized protein n=1 Tax=Lithospermum erythrorhizon TaxID=34254 RepID=A0AAV3QDC8_LITER
MLIVPFVGKSKPNSLELLEEGSIQTSSQGSGSRKSLYQMLEAVKIGDAERSGSINPSKKQKKHQGGRGFGYVYKGELRNSCELT